VGAIVRKESISASRRVYPGGRIARSSAGHRSIQLDDVFATMGRVADQSLAGRIDDEIEQL
jgi:hypothetical protein